MAQGAVAVRAGPDPQRTAGGPAAPAALVCDDHRTFADALAALLLANGWRVRVLTSPEAVEPALSAEPVDVCVLDFRFPGAADILPTCRSVARHFPDIPLLILTAGIGASDLGRALASGVTGVARKDQPPDVVLDAIRRVAAHEVVIDGSLVGGPTPRSGRASASGLLTPREREALEHLVLGHGTRRMAEEMRVSPATARTHIQNLLSKLGAHSRLEAAATAIRNGLVQIPTGAARSGPPPPDEEEAE